MTLYTRPQLAVLLLVVLVAGIGLGVGHWRRAHPVLAERLERLDRAAMPPHPRSTSSRSRSRPVGRRRRRARRRRSRSTSTTPLKTSCARCPASAACWRRGSSRRASVTVRSHRWRICAASAGSGARRSRSSPPRSPSARRDQREGRAVIRTGRRCRSCRWPSHSRRASRHVSAAQPRRVGRRGSVAIVVVVAAMRREAPCARRGRAARRGRGARRAAGGAADASAGSRRPSALPLRGDVVGRLASTPLPAPGRVRLLRRRRGDRGRAADAGASSSPRTATASS